MIVEELVNWRVPVDEDVRVSLFLGFVQVLGRSDREHAHHDAKQSGEEPGHLHSPMVVHNRFQERMNT